MKHPFPLCYSRYKFFFRQKLYIEQVTQGTDILNMSRQAKDLAQSSNKESRLFFGVNTKFWCITGLGFTQKLSK